MKRTGKSRIAVVGWGRGMGHKGHMYLADAVITQAINMKADPYFFVSKTVGKDDPIFPEEKVRIYQKVFPQYASIFEPQGNLNEALHQLAEMGYYGVVVVVGADQKQAFQYLERPAKDGKPVFQSLGLKTLKVISRQETNSKFANEEGPRATPMREVLLDPNASEEDKFNVWRRDMPDQLSDRDVLDVMNKAESRLIHSNKPKVTKVKSMSQKAAKLKEAIINFRMKKPVDQDAETEAEPLGYKHLFKQPGQEQKPSEKRFHGWDEYERETNPQQNPDEVEEARIMDPQSKVLVFYKPMQGGGEKQLTGRPVTLELANRIIDSWVHNVNSSGKFRPVNVEDFAIIPANANQYRRSSSPELAEEQLDEFAPDEGGEQRKFIPWTEFIEQLKQILHKNFSCKENVVKSTIKARFIPHDPMEFGPTMLYSYYETRGMGRDKGAVSTRGSIQVGKYTKGGLFGQAPDQLLTGFQLLKGHPFERHFDLTFDNIYKIANIIQGNTQGALEFQPQEVEETKVSKYKDLGATKDTTHFIKNVTTGEIVSPHRGKQDAEDALVAHYRGPRDGNEYKIVRARKDVNEDYLDE